jgi:hypothetical protein
MKISKSCAKQAADNQTSAERERDRHRRWLLVE